MGNGVLQIKYQYAVTDINNESAAVCHYMRLRLITTGKIKKIGNVRVDNML